MTSYVYMLSVFDNETDALVEEVELKGCDPLLLRDIFAPEENEYPYLLASYPLTEPEQIEVLRDCLPALDWDFEKLSYFVEANSV